MHRLVLICSAGFLFVSTILEFANGSPLSFLRGRVQEADDDRVIEGNEIDGDVVVAPPVVISQTRQPVKGKNKFKIINKEWVQMPKSPPGAISVPLRSHIELECEAIGSPAPQIYWLRGTEPLRQLDEVVGNSVADINTTPSIWGGIARTRSRLVIDCASPRDQGIIHCAAVAGSRIVLSKPTMLIIDELSKGNGSSCGAETKPRVTLYSPVMLAAIGSTVTLPCRANGRPRPPRTLWLDNDDRPITSSSNPRFKVLGTGELVIFPLNWDDMGGYTCIAQSDRDEDAASTFLYPTLNDENNS
ncbi:neural/ectodermal development factor IMP-L2 [Neodiprion virginianus]|uniref:neural/ectodermal development factor IMP-L2 n=1 Tax=Neodiprion virginianus TaxID=2961670 RepID=UPI001EE77EA1|nr:neural/ectodermal development factor IMP-L2 [Neodiprion virginianus]XP_046614411.1 neural/ectodermal development factor IMP-L2 [Neodiprion virginianus]